MARIFIVEDNQKISEVLDDYFKHINFHVSTFKSGNAVITEVKKDPPDVILLDLMLPGKDGLTVCREIRSFSKVPIIIITARVDEIDRLLGLELGADDYICKPFSPREVVARVKAVLRRSLPEFQEEKLVLGPITIKSDSHRVIIGDTDLRLTPVEFELLRIMASKPFNVFTRSDLISKIKGRNFDGYGRAVDSHIKNLRRKIDELLPGNRIIQTAYGMGYFISVYQTIKD